MAQEHGFYENLLKEAETRASYELAATNIMVRYPCIVFEFAENYSHRIF